MTRMESLFQKAAAAGAYAVLVCVVVPILAVMWAIRRKGVNTSP